MVATKAATVSTACALTFLSYLIILTRLGLRKLRHEAFKVDDYLMGSAMILYMAYTAVIPVAVYGGNNLDLHPDHMEWAEADRVSYGLKWLFIGRPFYVSYLWTLKICLVIFYTRLTTRKMELLVIKCVGGILAATWIANIFTTFLGCRPLHLNWQVYPEKFGCADAVAAIYVVGLSNIVTDLMLMVIPFHIILRSLIPMRTKLELGAVFILGFFAVLIVCLRMVSALHHWEQQDRLIWGQLECFTSTIVANAPILHGLWRHAWLHITKMNFKQNEACPPSYSMSVQRPTGQTEPEIDTNQLPVPESRGKARLSLRRMKDRFRHSWDNIEIERSVVLLQESKTGRFDPAEEAGGDTNFGGLASVARIITHIETGSTMEMGKVGRGSRISLLKMGRTGKKSTLGEGSEA